MNKQAESASEQIVSGQEQNQTNAAAQEYVTPELRDYGTVQELTQSSGRGLVDDGAGAAIYISGVAGGE